MTAPLPLRLHSRRTHLLLLVALPWSAGAVAAVAQPTPGAGRVDTVRIDQATLARALADPLACRSPDAGRGMWPDPPTAVQFGRGLIHESGQVTLLDSEAGVLRVLHPDGRERARLGRNGSGPGEFLIRNSMLVHWAGDTVAVHDIRNGRITLFTPAGMAQAYNLAEVPTLVIAAPMGRLRDGTLVFATGLDPQNPPLHPVVFRPPITLSRWRPGSKTVEPFRADIPGPEWHPMRFGDKQGIALANLARVTWFGVSGDLTVIHDNAKAGVELVDRAGRTVRVIALALTDPPVTAVDRDSVSERLERVVGRVQPIPPVLKRFPATRPATLWSGVDAAGGIWLSVHPPLAAGAAVHLRLTATGQIDRCHRPTAGARTIAFGRDRILTIVEQEAGDVINVERTAPYPERR